MQEVPEFADEFRSISGTAQQDDEIVAISEIAPYTKPMLHEAVQFVQVDVGEKLAGHVAQRKSVAGRLMETAEDSPNEPLGTLIADSATDEIQKDTMVNGRTAPAGSPPDAYPCSSCRSRNRR